MLVFFMISQLKFGDEQANLQYGATQAFVYAFTFVGGLFADKILGFRKSLFWGGILMIIGSLILAANPHDYFFLGISFTVVGTGFFKPNISTMVGKLYKPNDSRTDAGFSLFYAGINLGALLGGYLCIAIGKGEMFSDLIPEYKRWNIAFGLAAIVMVVSLINFIFTQRSLGPIGLQPQKLNADGTFSPLDKWKEYGVYILSLVFIPLIMIMVSVPIHGLFYVDGRTIDTALSFLRDDKSEFRRTQKTLGSVDFHYFLHFILGNLRTERRFIKYFRSEKPQQRPFRIGSKWR